MRVAALYDIHGNLPALEIVLEEVRRTKVDAIVVGGDVVPGPMPRECLELLRDTGIPTEFHSNLVRHLSIASALAMTPLPVYGIRISSSAPCTVPSSPKRPCSAMNTRA